MIEKPSGPLPTNLTGEHAGWSGSEPAKSTWEEIDETETTRPLETLEDEAPHMVPSGGNVRIPVLTVVAGRALGRVIKIDQDQTYIGRGPEMQVALADKGVSRRHALIAVKGEQLFLQDLGSTNGTFLNDRLAKEPVLLQQGDRIRIGLTTLLRFGYQDKFDEKIREKLYELATRDPLTGAFNRRYFDDRMEMEWSWSRRHEKPCALFVIDADWFKRVNDQHGHAAGDFVLRELTQCMLATIRTEDTLARVGGEEFFLLARATDERAALAFGERIRVAVATHEFVYKGASLPITVSLGICTSNPSLVNTMEDLMRLADAALYQSKKEGRNRVCFAHRETLPKSKVGRALFCHLSGNKDSHPTAWHDETIG